MNDYKMISALMDVRSDIWARWHDVRRATGSDVTEPERRQLNLALGHVDLALKNLRNARDAREAKEAKS